MTPVSALAAEGDLDLLRQAGGLLAGLPGTKMVRHPEKGLYGMVHRDSVGNRSFLLGELLVTSAEAEVNGELGYSCVLGDEDDRAAIGALLDAALRTDLAVRPELDRLLAEIDKDLTRRRDAGRLRVAATTVAFDVRPQ